MLRMLTDDPEHVISGVSPKDPWENPSRRLGLHILVD